MFSPVSIVIRTEGGDGRSVGLGRRGSVFGTVVKELLDGSLCHTCVSLKNGSLLFEVCVIKCDRKTMKLLWEISRRIQ